MDQVPGVQPTTGVEWDQERVSDLWDLVLFPSPHFAFKIAYIDCSNQDVFDPEVNSLLIPTDNFAPGIFSVKSRLSFKVGFPTEFRLASYCALIFYDVSAGHNFEENVLLDWSSVSIMSVHPKSLNCGFWCRNCTSNPGVRLTSRQRFL